MEPRVTLVTLGVVDLARAVRFYRDGLGWPMSSASAGDMAAFKLDGLVLMLWGRDLLAADAGVPNDNGFGGIALAHNVHQPEQVDAVLAAAAAAGATITRPAHDADWGGRTGYFLDPDGHAWEVAWNPGWPLGPDGRMTIPD